MMIMMMKKKKKIWRKAKWKWIINENDKKWQCENMKIIMNEMK